MSPISLGQELRRAREVRHVTLAQLAAETRIALRHLEALEQDRIDDLPGRLYARNFTKQVARTLGADEQELLDYFDYQTGEVGRVAAADETLRAKQGARRRLAYGALAVAALIIASALGFALTRGGSPDDSASRPEAPTPDAAPAAVDVATVLVPAEAESTGPSSAVVEPVPEPAKAAPVESEAPKQQAKPAPPKAVAETAPAPKPDPPVVKPEVEAVVVSPVPEPAAEPKPAEAEPSAPAAPPSLQVRLAFKGPSWIEIVPEGEGRQIMGLKTAGQEVAFPLDSPVELTVANAGNVELWLDGKPTRPLGVPGERRTLRLDADNWQSFLR